ncbi:thiamine ABC transporter substrate-binding protein [Desulfobotulus sp. H1]|uniref:Thiamine ABC transporter substrate-binding protein n=1 Tax=Desulfobotulus pelophilus TaxID=2823377 RepID=A0ABT3NAX6_9BACT|nr:thiamine ABC transporter substrate-binding protein [Desulfobotulus pelophilus]MCW7754619.1 thiamine ABC transporter substrate-binding protein [Desulfobotulus pelophilus]
MGFYKIISVFLLACLTVFPARAAEPVLRVMSHDSFTMDAAQVRAFEEAHGVKVRFLKASGTGAALNQAILSRGKPMADVFYGVDNTFMGRALDADIFLPHASFHLKDVPDDLKLDPSFRLTPMAYGDICINYDRAWFAEKGLTPPSSLKDLLKPEYEGLLVVQNPATSSPGLGFLLATVDTFGEEGWSDFWRGLRKNGVRVVSSWKEGYWGHFTAASRGRYPLVVSYAASPAAEVHFAEKKPDKSPTAAITAEGTGFRQVEFAGILKGTKVPDLAALWLDWMLDIPVQEGIPLSMFMFPANEKARLPEVFQLHVTKLEGGTGLSAERMDAMREAWMDEWTRVVLR